METSYIAITEKNNQEYYYGPTGDWVADLNEAQALDKKWAAEELIEMTAKQAAAAGDHVLCSVVECQTSINGITPLKVVAEHNSDEYADKLNEANYLSRKDIIAKAKDMVYHYDLPSDVKLVLSSTVMLLSEIK